MSKREVKRGLFLKPLMLPVNDAIIKPSIDRLMTLNELDNEFDWFRKPYLLVLFRNPSKTVDLAMRRFKEEKSGNSIFRKSSGFGYKDIVKSFVTGGNCINYYDVAKVPKSDLLFLKKH